MNSKSLNILYLSSFGDAMRGGQKSLLNLVSNLNRETFRGYVIVPTENGGLAESLKNQNIYVCVVKFPKIKDYHIIPKLKAFSKLIKVINRQKIDIIHTDGPRNTFYAGIAAKIKKIPLVWHVRAFNRDRYDRILTKLSSRIIIVADILRSRFNVNSGNNKFVTIHNGVDLTKFRPQKNKKFVRQNYGISDNGLLISVIARIERPKGQVYLIEACGKLKNRIKDFHILLAGEITDNNYMNECIKIAFKLGIHNRIIFAGSLNNINQVLNETDIFVLPSLSEAFPRSIIEAMAVGIPVIATDVGGNAEAIENSVSGFIINSRDSNAMAEKIYLLEQSPNLRLKIGDEARNRAVKFFGVHENVKKVENVYKELLLKDTAT